MSSPEPGVARKGRVAGEILPATRRRAAIEHELTPREARAGRRWYELGFWSCAPAPACTRLRARDWIVMTMGFAKLYEMGDAFIRGALRAAPVDGIDAPAIAGGQKPPSEPLICRHYMGGGLGTWLPFARDLGGSATSGFEATG